MIDPEDDQRDVYCRRCGADPCCCEDDRELFTPRDNEPSAPHTHVYVSTDRGDACAVCGLVLGSNDQGDEWASDPDDADEPVGIHLPVYEFGGEG